MRYRPEVDGLRAIAVLPVILFHAGFSAFSGGFVGVDVFFVISGYLITTVICQEMAQARFSMLHFYERRARRILPALFVVTAACIPFAWLWMLPQDFKSFSQSLVGVATFTSNIFFWGESGYFAGAAELKPLLHTWSLAVEEQFYILYPPLLLFLYRFIPKQIFLLITLGVLASLGLAHYASTEYPDANFYLLPSRAWELGVGALVALYLHQIPLSATSSDLGGTSPADALARPIPESAGLLGLLLIGYGIVVFDETTPFPSLWALIPVLGTALIILAVDSQTLVGRLLSRRFLVKIGLLSYSAYLWHQPLFAFARIRLFDGVPVWIYWLLIALTFALAWLTWLAIEIPARKYLTLPRLQVLSVAAAGCIAVGIVGGLGWAADGLPNRVAPSGISFSEIDSAGKANHGLSSVCERSFTLSPECRSGENPSVMVWGDSHAMHLMQGLISSQSSRGIELIQFTKHACAPVFDLAQTSRKLSKRWAEGCIEFNNSVKEWLEHDEDIDYVIMSSPMVIIQSRTYDSRGVLNPPSEGLVMEKLNTTAEYIRALGKKPVFISSPPHTGEDLARCVMRALTFVSDGGTVTHCNFGREDLSPGYEKRAQFLHSPNLELPVIDLSNYLCDEKECKAAVNETSIFQDDDHLSHAGSAFIGKEYDLLGVAMEAAEVFSLTTAP